MAAGYGAAAGDLRFAGPPSSGGLAARRNRSCRWRWASGAAAVPALRPGRPTTSAGRAEPRG
eukprot:15433441-Alexandrium_andersonii.AAC.1